MSQLYRTAFLTSLAVIISVLTFLQKDWLFCIVCVATSATGLFLCNSIYNDEKGGK